MMRERISRDFIFPLALALTLTATICSGDDFDEKNYGVKFADDCEVCKIVSVEFTTLLAESASKHGVVETGYSIDRKKKKTKYVKSELRLVETLEELCGKLWDYRIHKERNDWTRFARGTSETFKALEGLVDKGVKVDIGIPKELWGQPSAEVTHLKTQCEQLLEEHEEDIEDWYFKHQEKQSLEDYLCRKKALRTKDKSCLDVKGEIGESQKTEL